MATVINLGRDTRAADFTRQVGGGLVNFLEDRRRKEEEQAFFADLERAQTREDFMAVIEKTRDPELREIALQQLNLEQPLEPQERLLLTDKDGNTIPVLESPTDRLTAEELDKLGLSFDQPESFFATTKDGRTVNLGRASNRQEAQRIADEQGVDVDQILSEKATGAFSDLERNLINRRQLSIAEREAARGGKPTERDKKIDDVLIRNNLPTDDLQIRARAANVVDNSDELRKEVRLRFTQNFGENLDVLSFGDKTGVFDKAQRIAEAALLNGANVSTAASIGFNTSTLDLIEEGISEGTLNKLVTGGGETEELEGGGVKFKGLTTQENESLKQALNEAQKPFADSIGTDPLNFLLTVRSISKNEIFDEVQTTEQFEQLRSLIGEPNDKNLTKDELLKLLPMEFNPNDPRTQLVIEDDFGNIITIGRIGNRIIPVPRF